MMTIRFVPLVAALSALLAAVPAAAQTGNFSDVTGGLITGSGVVGGGFQGGSFRQLHSALFSNPNGTVVFTSAAVAAAFRAEMARASAALRDGELRPLLPCAADSAVDEVLLRVLEGGPEGEAAARLLAASLRGPAPEESRLGRAAAEVAEEMTGLFAHPMEARGRFTPAGEWEEAMRAWDAYVALLPQEFLDTCPSGTLTVHAFFTSFVDAGLQAAGLTREEAAG